MTGTSKNIEGQKEKKSQSQINAVARYRANGVGNRLIFTATTLRF